MEESYVVLSYPGRCTFFAYVYECGATLFAISAMLLRSLNIRLERKPPGAIYNMAFNYTNYTVTHFVYWG
jgi:hypothetical protein